MPRIKRELRAAVRSQRNSISTAERHRRDLAIRENLLIYLHSLPGLTPGDWVAAYMPMPGEPGGEEMASAILDAGYRLILPQVKEKTLEWTALDARTSSELHNSLERSDWGILEPTPGSGEKFSDSFITIADVGIIPALSIDRTGVRLGQGGGFYDRTLTLGYPRKGLCGVIDHHEFVDTLPTAWHDCVVNAIVTDNSIYFPNGQPHYPE